MTAAVHTVQTHVLCSGSAALSPVPGIGTSTPEVTLRKHYPTNAEGSLPVTAGFQSGSHIVLPTADFILQMCLVSLEALDVPEGNLKG